MENKIKILISSDNHLGYKYFILFLFYLIIFYLYFYNNIKKMNNIMN